jgi:TatD DNase family protein
MVTFRRADEIRAMAVSVPGDRLLVETDSPYLAPEPRRGRRNEPAYVRHVGERLAAERGVDADQLAAATTAAFRALFRGAEGWPRQADRQ